MRARTLTHTFSWTMATYGRIIKTSFRQQSSSCSIKISATRVFPPLVGNEYIKFFLSCTEFNVKQVCCHSAELKKKKRHYFLLPNFETQKFSKKKIKSLPVRQSSHKDKCNYNQCHMSKIPNVQVVQPVSLVQA